MAENQEVVETETEMVPEDLERGSPPPPPGKQQQQQQDNTEALYSPKTAMHFISKSLSSRFNSARDQAHAAAAFLTIRVKQDQRSNSNLVELDFSHNDKSSGRSFDSTELLNRVGTGANIAQNNNSLSSNTNTTTTTVGVGGSSEIVLYSHKSNTERVQIAVDSVGFSIKTSNKAKDLSNNGSSSSGGGGRGTSLNDHKSKVKVDKNGMRHVLRDISGIHDAGRMLAILGPSGAGKTTLLNILGGNLRQTSGQIMLNGEEAYSPTDITELSAFVHQDDCLLPTMTVKETILFAAHMRLPYSMSNSKKAQRAANAISLLGLKKCQHTMIGSTVEGTRGVSGGERKRCAIATELLTNPSVIFLDEPSSGLDAYAAFSLGSVLKTLCHLGKTVVMTIHQPSSDLYDLFDDMLLLANGETVFWGPSANSVQYFAQLGYSCPPFCNPCDYFFLHVLNVSSPSGDMKLQQLHEAWRTSASSRATKKGISHLLADNENTIKDIILSQKAGVPCLRKMSLLTRRGFKHFFRNKMLLPSRLLQALLSSLVAMAVFWGVTDNQTGIMARSGVLFYFAANTLFSSVLSVLSAFSSERSVFMREYSNGAYSVFVYFFSKILVEYPFQILIPILVSASSYFAVGLQANVANFFVFCTCLVLVNLVGTNIGLMLSSAFSDVSIALSLAPLFVLPLMLFSGFFISYDDTPGYVAWIQAISPVRYAFAALMQNEFDGLELHCTSSQVIPTGIPGLDICPIENGSQYIELYGYNLLDVTRCIVMLGILLVCSLLVAYMTLFVSAAKSRGRSLFCFSTYFNHN